MTLQPSSTLQGGKYKIEKVLGQGGFGITYLAEQTMLERKVAIKEFFMKEFCERDESTSHVTLGSGGIRATVDRFREKFLKEARNIAKLKHPHIIQILDVFEENGTAYYVMEYAENGSLSILVADNQSLPEAQATRYILQVADALAYIHQRKMNHLDIKPSNIMLNEKDEALLIDFGLSKQYDEVGQQTSTTPVGLSEGYAPMEQYKQGGVTEFSPETDIYALGATFFKLLTGKTPPGASDVYDEGLPVAELEKKGVSQAAIDAIIKAMEPRRKNRMHDVMDFINMLKEGMETSHVNTNNHSDSDNVNNDESTIILPQAPIKEECHDQPEVESSGVSTIHLFWLVLFGILICVIVANCPGGMSETVTSVEMRDSTDVDSIETGYQFTVNGVSFRMVRVDGGTFQMGATPEQNNDSYDDEKPVHSVTLSSYYIGQTEVTQALWQAVMGSNPSYFKGSDQPVENVSWEDCQTFITKLNRLTGQKFRLPTEAEWEYAARGGKQSKGYKYSGSNTLDNVAWYESNGNGCNETHPVATKQANELGLYDMSGNVMEWCQDWYDENYYKKSPSNNPTGPSSGSGRVDRGGGWGDNARGCLVCYRSGITPSFAYGVLGFRLALSAR